MLTHFANRFKDLSWSLILLLLAAWLVFNFLQTLHWITADYSLIPFMDYWRVPQQWADYHASHWSNLWAQHNEHRIVFPELFYVADMFWLHGRMYLPIATSGLCYIGVWFVLVWAVYSQKVMHAPARELAVLLAGILIAWKGCSSVIATPFQLSFTMMQLAAAVAFFLLAKLAEGGRKRNLAGVIAAAVVANYSCANGIIIWFVLIAAACLLRVKPRQILVLIAAGALSISAFFFQYHFLPSKISGNVRHLALAVQFLCSYMSMPFGSSFDPAVGVAIGAANLILIGVCFCMVWRRKLLRSRLAVLLFGVYAFTLLSAVLTTLGRMDLYDFGFIQAKSARYVTMPTVAWASLTIALLWLVGEARSSKWPLAVACLIGGFFAYGFSQSAGWAESTRQDAQNAQITATMLQNDVFDPDQVRTNFPFPEFVRAVAALLSANHKSIYAHGADRWIGQNVAHLRPSSVPVAGAITRVYPVPGGLELFGWADTSSLAQDHAVLFVDASQTVVGFGRRPAAGLPLNIAAWDTPNSLAFVGFVSLKKPVSELSVYVRTFHGKLVQPMAGKVEVPAFTLLDKRPDTAAIAGITWRHDPSWTANGFNPSWENGPLPTGPVLGSWSGSDTRTGRLNSEPFPVPPDHCLILPVLHGAVAYKQSVEVRDADTNQLIANLPMLDGRSIWERWRIPIPAQTRHVKIEADDEGAGQGQWVAVGNPEFCP